MKYFTKIFFAIILFNILVVYELKGQKIVPHNSLKTPTFIDYVHPMPSAETWKNTVKQIGGYGNEITWKIYNVLKDELNQTHSRIQMYKHGIPVELGTAILHTKMNDLFRVNGNFILSKDILGKANLTANEAREFALKHLPSEKYYWQDLGMNQVLQNATNNKDTTYFPKGKLVYVGRNFKLDTIQQLCYSFNVLSMQPLAGKTIYVNAENGQIWATNDLILHAETNGTAITKYSGTRTIKTDSLSPTSFRLRETGRGNGIETYNVNKTNTYVGATDFTDNDNTWNNVNANKDEVATDAHWGAEMTYDYFKNEHGRNSFDNAGAKIVNYVHYCQTPGVGYDNAFWNGSVMTYGDGSTFLPLTALDVCGHEIAHAVTTNTANLTYSNESGALNESFSDIFGQTIEAWARPTQWNWKIGEDITVSGAGIRNMADPSAVGYNQPKYYKGNKWFYGPLDNGGVHYNSGVQNYWYYLIANGASGTNEVSNAFNIASLGFTKSAKIAYRTLSVYLVNSSNYADARTYSILSATDLYGQCSNEVVQVTNAWWVCGVGAKYDSGYVKANFTGDTLACKTAKLVNFQNLSTNYLNSKWYFGDGGTSTVSNPSYNYTAYGKFNVKLVVTSCNNSKSDSITFVKFVSVDSTRDICNAIILPTSGTSNETRCWGYVYDNGGESDYILNKNVSTTLTVANADSIRYRFLMFDMENGYDSLYLYDMGTTPKTELGAFTGSGLPFAGAWKTVYSNSIQFKQQSDPYASGKGFKIQYIGYRPKLKIDLGNDTVICQGDSVNIMPKLMGGNSSDLFVTPPSLSRTVMNKTLYKVGPTSPTKYYFKVTDACTGLSAIDSITVGVYAPISVDLLPKDTTVCYGRNVVLKSKVTGGRPTSYTYYWSQAASYGPSSEMVLPHDTTDYFVIVDDGCSDKADTAFARVNMRDQLQVVPVRLSADVCPGTNVNLVVSGTGGDPANYLFTWDHGLGTGTTKTVSVTDTTVYYVVLTDGCTVGPDDDSIQVNIPSTLVLSNVNDTTLCAAQNLPMNLVSAGGRISTHYVSWSDPAIIGYTPTLNPLEGLTSYQAILSDGCMLKNDTVNFAIKKLPPITATWSISDKKMCLGDSFDVLFNVKGGDSTQYSWLLNGGTVNTTNHRLSLAASQAVQLSITDACSPAVNLSENIVISPSKLNLALLTFDTTNCFGRADAFLEVNTAASNSPVTYLWNDPLNQTTAKISNLNSAVYQVVAKDTFGCEDSLKWNVVTFNKVYDALVDTIMYRGTVIQLRLKNAMPSKWVGPAILGKDSALNISIRPLKDTIYTVSGMDINGCSGKDTVRVAVIDPPTLRIPNIITPNGDRKNEVWDLIELGELEMYDLTISDRYGKRVYSTDNYQNDWNAVDSDGNELPNGQYLYKLKHRKNFKVLQGYIQVIR